MRAAVLHVAVDLSVHEAWNTAEADPARLLRAVELIPPLIALTAGVERAFDESIVAVDRMERDAIGRLHAALYLPDQPLIAALVVVPEVARLVEAARLGTLADAAPSLTDDERAAIVAASSRNAGAATRRDRVQLDALALRLLIERDLASFKATAPPPAEDAEGAEHDRIELCRRLESQRRAHEFVSRSLEAVRSERFARSHAPDRPLDQARRTLFAAYVQLSKALAGQSNEAEDSVRARILEAEREAAVVDAEKATTQNLLRQATAGVSSPTPEAVLALPEVRDLARERRRRRVLIGVAAALAPCALTANIVLHRGGGSKATAPSPDFLSRAMPVREVMPIGQALYSQVSTLLWDDLTAPERREKVKELGRLAAERGYQALLVVDESRRERARWSLTGGTELVEDRRPN
jgi:hypothetical protein